MRYFPDLRDILWTLGLGSLAAGLAMYDPRLAFVVVGLLLLTLGTVAAWRART